MIRITGDPHGDISRFYELYYNHGEGHWTKDDILIFCGDWGFLFLNNKSENSFLDDLSSRPYTICFVDGNHENFDAINAYPLIEWNGGKAHQIRKNIFHLMRGQVFEIDGKTFFTMGGAYSIDKGSRTPGYSWWPDELPTDADYKEATSNLQKHGMKVDYIITHTLPREMILRLGKYPDAHDMELTGFLEWIMYEVDFKHWYCGHWHDDKELNDQFTILWFDVKEL